MHPISEPVFEFNLFYFVTSVTGWSERIFADCTDFGDTFLIVIMAENFFYWWRCKVFWLIKSHVSSYVCKRPNFTLFSQKSSSKTKFKKFFVRKMQLHCFWFFLIRIFHIAAKIFLIFPNNFVQRLHCVLKFCHFIFVKNDF